MLFHLWGVLPYLLVLLSSKSHFLVYFLSHTLTLHVAKMFFRNLQLHISLSKMVWCCLAYHLASYWGNWLASWGFIWSHENGRGTNPLFCLLWGTHLITSLSANSGASRCNPCQHALCSWRCKLAPEAGERCGSTINSNSHGRPRR